MFRSRSSCSIAATTPGGVPPSFAGRGLTRSSSYEDMHSPNASLVEYVHTFIPYVSVKTVAKCVLPEVFPKHILKSNDDDSMDMAVCIADPDVDACELLVRERVRRQLAAESE